MSAQFWVLLGVVLGALLAGAANLLLAWRKETQEARAGAQVLLDILGRSERQIDQLLNEENPRWWRPGIVPTSEPWQAYRHPLSVRLPRAAMAEIESAMAKLDGINQLASRATTRSDELEVRIWDATVAYASEASADEPHEQPLVAKLIDWSKKQNLRGLKDGDRSLLGEARDQFRAARQRLAAVSPVRLSSKPQPSSVEKSTAPGKVWAWGRWHQRPLAGAALLAAGVGIALIAALPQPKSDVERVQDTLAEHVEDEALTACEAVKDHSTRFSCVVVKQANRAACKTRSDSAPTLIQLASVSATPTADNDQCGTGNTQVQQALEYLGVKADDEDCTDFSLVRAADLPSATDQAEPSFLRRLLSRLRHGSPTGPSAGQLPSVLVPDTVVPDGAFVAC